MLLDFPELRIDTNTYVLYGDLISETISFHEYTVFILKFVGPKKDF